MKYEFVTFAVLLCSLLSACSLHPQSARTSTMDYYSGKKDWMNAYMAGDKDYGCVQYWFARTFGIGKNAYVSYLQNMVECGRHIDALQGTEGFHIAEKYERELSKYTGSAQGVASPTGNVPAPELVAEVPDDAVPAISPSAGATVDGASTVTSGAPAATTRGRAGSAGKAQPARKQGSKKGAGKSTVQKKKSGKPAAPRTSVATPAEPKKNVGKPAVKAQEKTPAPAKKKPIYLD